MQPSYKKSMTLDGTTYQYYDIKQLAGSKLGAMPFSLRILLENLMRHQSEGLVTQEMLEALINRDGNPEIPFYPARVLMQDFTGVPSLVDLAALRDSVEDPHSINPHVPVDLIVDHSVQVDSYGSPDSRDINAQFEYDRNHERYSFLKWAQKSFTNFKIVPPNSGICHQVNLEYLAQVVRAENNTLFPDSVIGLDSHTPMVNGLGVMGWGVGGIEAEAVILGQPYFMPIPRAVGVRLSGTMDKLCTATDLVLTITHLLRKTGVVGAFVEYFGPGLPTLSIPDRATIGNMSPEYGATMGFFPVDERTIEYLRFTGRVDLAKRTEVYCKANALFHTSADHPHYDEVIELDLATIEPCIAGPYRPQDRIPLRKARMAMEQAIPHAPQKTAKITLDGTQHTISDGTIAIAAITSCTNTSNPSVMLGAGLMARNAAAKGLRVSPWVKTSLAPGSQVVADYLEKSHLIKDLETLGFHIVAFGCTTCIGNSGPLHPAIEAAQEKEDLTLAAVLSGNRNFAGRIHKNVKASFLMSPPLVVAYALAGHMDIDFAKDPLGQDTQGNPVFLSDIWPDTEEINQLINKHMTQQSFISAYKEIFTGDENWKNLWAPEGDRFAWDEKSTYIAKVPFFDNFPLTPPPIRSIKKARALLVIGDSVTTDHISPAGSIDPTYPSGKYLLELGVPIAQFNTYGSRRGNHEVMLRGTFANTRIKQRLTAPKEGGFTRKFPEGTIMHVYDAAMAYRGENVELIIIAGKEYGTGSSRDWAAKGSALLGVRAVVAESFERIHRSNLMGMGVLPLEFKENTSITTYNLEGNEQFSLDIPTNIEPKMELTLEATTTDGKSILVPVICRLDSLVEVEYYKNGGILHYVLRKLLQKTPSKK